MHQWTGEAVSNRLELPMPYRTDGIGDACITERNQTVDIIYHSPPPSSSTIGTRVGMNAGLMNT